MRNTETIKIGGRDITVTEVSVRQIMRVLPFLNGDEKDGEQDEGVEKPFMDNVKELLRASCGLTPDDLLDLVSSEYEQLWQAFKKVNSFFFRSAKALGLGERLELMIGSVLDGVGEQFAASLKEDIRKSLTMDLAGLPGQQSTPKGSGSSE